MADGVTQLNQWENFYVIVGSSAGALTGLQFVVIALIAEAKSAGSMREVRAFGTPTIVHFCVALMIAAIVSAPWGGLAGAAYALAICGMLGAIYQVSVIRHARAQTGYRPDAEDWFWYAGVPLSAHIALVAAALFLSRSPTASLFVVAGVTLALLFVGIHNAWDTVTYVAVRRWRASSAGE